MPESAAGEVVVLYLYDELRLERFPLGRPLGAPPAWPAGRLAREARRADELLQFRHERFALRIGERRCESDVLEQSILVVQTEQHRADHSRLAGVAEPADYAIGRAHTLDLLHSRALARAIRQVHPLGDDSVEPA